MSSPFSGLAGWGQEARAKIAARRIRPAPAPDAPSPSAETDIRNNLSDMIPGAGPPGTAADTHLYAVTAVITKVLGGWIGGRIGTSDIKGVAERVATVVVEQSWQLVNDALKDPKIRQMAVDVVKRTLTETAYFVGGRFGGLLMKWGADYVADRIIQALSAQSMTLSTAPQVLADWEVEDARPGGLQRTVGADRDAELVQETLIHTAA